MQLILPKRRFETPSKERFQPLLSLVFALLSGMDAGAGPSRPPPPRHAAYLVELASAVEAGPTATDLNTVPVLGLYSFTVRFNLSSSRRSLAWSELLNKLFIDMNSLVEVEFQCSPDPPPGCFVRALPVFAEPAEQRKPVQRCPHHARPADITNANFEFVGQLVRADSPAAVYCEDLQSGRLSLLLPLRPATALLRFLCLGSCPGGINRRPLLLVFTLEDGAAGILGRATVNLRICSCPRRDLNTEEARFALVSDNSRR